MAAFGSAVLTASGAGANHEEEGSPPAEDRRWIAQGGRGDGSSQAVDEGQGLPVIEDMNVLSVLFHTKRFPLGNPQGGARLGFTKYLAFGLIRHFPPQIGTVVSQLAISKSDNGSEWSAPALATIRDANGVDVPFILNEPGGFFDVMYHPTTPPGATSPFAQFNIYYRIFEGVTTNVASIHTAWSDDGQTWYNDKAIAQNVAAKVVTGVPGDFNEASFGPTDIIYQPTKSNDPGCASTDPDGAAGPLVPSPWNCRLVMVFDAIGNGGRHSVGTASAPDVSFLGTTMFTALPAPLVGPGAAGEWDDFATTLAKVRLRPNPADTRFPMYDLYYSGARAGNDCFGDSDLCYSFGTATSTGLQQGLLFTKTTGNPVTPRQLLEIFALRAPHTLWAPSIVDDAGQDGNGSGHATIFFSRISNGDTAADPDILPERDMYLAYTEPDPTPAPRVRIASPIGVKSAFGRFRNRTDTPIEFYVTDSLGSPGLVGVNLATLVISIDGAPLPGGWTAESPHLVSALKEPAVKVVISSGVNQLADGPHTFSVSVSDLEGNTGFASSSFVVDTVPPSTTITSFPPSPAVGFPIDGIGTFKGEIVEGSPTTGTAIDRLDVTVTNPLGMTRTYQVQGALVKKSTSKNWTFSWVVPTSDTHLMLPGQYTFAFRATDVAQNGEAETASNTIVVLVI